MKTLFYFLLIMVATLTLTTHSFAQLSKGVGHHKALLKH